MRLPTGPRRDLSEVLHFSESVSLNLITEVTRKERRGQNGESLNLIYIEMLLHFIRHSVINRKVV